MKSNKTENDLINFHEVLVIGLGYIGLPTAALIASKSVKVLGFDINSDVVNTINRGEIHIVEPDLKNSVSEAVKKKNLIASNKPLKANNYLIVVPTPFKGKNEPDISFVEAATKSVIPLLKKGDLYIIESTCPVGTTEKMMNLIYNERPELNGHLFIAYCPERVLPGNVMYELVYNDRVIGGVDAKSTEKAISFYKKFVKGDLHPTNARTAEMCKLVENSSRDVQIAFANELSLICDKSGINVWDLIKLANKHPRVNILQPGCGVGGHCIAVDPYFIISNFPSESKIIETARQINNYKSYWCIEKIVNAIAKYEIDKGVKPSVGLMGLSFKPDIDDLRESPALQIAKKVIESDKNCNFFIVEPNLKAHKYFHLTHYKEAVKKSDILVFLVKHKEFSKIQIPSEKTVLNFCGL